MIALYVLVLALLSGALVYCAPTRSIMERAGQFEEVIVTMANRQTFVGVVIGPAQDTAGNVVGKISELALSQVFVSTTSALSAAVNDAVRSAVMARMAMRRTAT